MNTVAAEPPRFARSISFGIVERQEVQPGLVDESRDDSNMDTSLMPLQDISRIPDPTFLDDLIVSNIVHISPDEIEVNSVAMSSPSHSIDNPPWHPLLCPM
jgi:hypothetical protein